MAWIETKLPTAKNPEVASALREARGGLPAEYSSPHQQVPKAVAKESIVLAHSLLPTAMKHAAQLLSALFDPSLPLSRREHELVAAAVSTMNECFY